MYKTHRRSLNSKASEAKPEFDIEEIREMVQTEVKAELARRAKLSKELTRKEFDHYFRFWTGSAGFVEVYDGTAWVQVASFVADIGAWSNPDHQIIDVTAYQNSDFQVRFRYDDLGGAWGWFWALDNVELDGALAPCTDVRVEVLTDVYGDEISWEIVLSLIHI